MAKQKNRQSIEILRNAGAPPEHKTSTWMKTLLEIRPGDAVLFREIQRGSPDILRLRTCIAQYKIRRDASVSFVTRLTPEGLKVWRIS